MSVLKRLSSNPTLRGLLTFYHEYLGISKRKFGYVGSDVVGKNKNMLPPTKAPVAKNTSPARLKCPLVKELKKPAYNNKLQ